MIKVSADTSQITQVNRKLKSLAKRFRDLRPALKLAGYYLMKEFTDRIDRQGPGWKPLSVVTKLLRVKGEGKKFSGWGDVESVRAKALADTGRLRSSLTPRRQQPGRVFILTHNSLEAGTNMKYAKKAMGLAGPQTFNLPPGWWKRVSKNTTKKFRRESGVYLILKSMEGKRYKIPKRAPVFVSRENRVFIKMIFQNYAAKMVRQTFGR